MSTMKIKKGDTVRVIAGKDKDKEGKVLAVNQKKETVVVEGVNMHTKHEKPSAANQNGGRIEAESPLHVSNVMYLHKGQPTRIGFQVEETKKGFKKSRIAKSTGDVIDVVTEKKN